MKKKSMIIVLLALLCVAIFTAAASANQEGNKRWCNSDKYGCWITAEDGGKNYIKFWSEEARELFMGPKTEPGTLVETKPTNLENNELPLEDFTPRVIYIRNYR